MVDDTLTGNSVFCQGALTHGDRRATESRDLSRFNFDNKVNFGIFSIVDVCSLCSDRDIDYC